MLASASAIARDDDTSAYAHHDGSTVMHDFCGLAFMGCMAYIQKHDDHHELIEVQNAYLHASFQHHFPAPTFIPHEAGRRDSTRSVDKCR